MLREDRSSPPPPSGHAPWYGDSAYEVLFEQVGSGIAIFRAVDQGADFVFLDFNPAAERIERIPRSDVLGRRVTEIFPAVRDFGLLEVFEEVWRTGQAAHHPVRLYRDGRVEGWRENHVYQLPSGEIVAVYHDRTVEMEAENRFQQLAGSIREVFWLGNLDWSEVDYASPAFEDVWGRSCEALYDDPRCWFEAIHPEDREAVSRDLERKRSGDKNDPRLPAFRVIRPDGQTRWIVARGFVMRDEKGMALRMAGLAEDVTDRRRIEEALDRSESRFRATFEQAAVGMAHVGRDGRFLRLNEKLCAITGYDREELQALTFRDITHPDDLEADLSLAADLWSGKVSQFRMDKRYIRKNGTEVWVALTASTVPDARGRPEYGIAVVEDISVRKAAEALRADEELQRMALSAANAAVWKWDITANSQIWSPESYDIFGIDPAEPPPDFDAWLVRCVHPDDRAKFDALRSAQTSSSSGEFLIEFRSPHPRKGLRWLLSLGRRVHDPERNAVRAYGLNLDITERRQNEEALRTGEERLRLSMSAGDIGLWDWDIASGHVVWSDNLARMTQMQPGTFAGTFQTFQELVHPEDRDRVAEALRQAIEGEADYHIEFRMLKPDGEERWSETRASLLRDDDGRPVRMIGVDMDITDRKAGEARQALLTSELNHRVKNLLATVQSTMTQTLRASQSLEAFGEAFSARLRALDRGNDLLVRNAWSPVVLEELLHNAFEYFGGPDRILVRAAELRMEPPAALALNMIMHELATNAVKYGSLSVPDGIVEVDCSKTADAPWEVVCRWTERGGPPALPPVRRGFGSTLIERSTRHSLGGEAAISYLPEGLECVIRFPLRTEPATGTADSTSAEERVATGSAKGGALGSGEAEL